MMCALAHHQTSMHVNIKRVHISAVLIQHYSSSGTRLLVLTWENIPMKPYSHKKVRWKCDQCPDGHPHSWLARVNNRTRGNGCPQCSGRQVCKHNSLATKAPLVAAQWDFAANDATPDDVVAQSNHMANWHCKLCSCKWKAAIDARVSKKKAGCPHCCENAKTKTKTRQPTFADCNHPLLAQWDHKHKSNNQIFWLCQVPSRAGAQLVCSAL